MTSRKYRGLTQKLFLIESKNINDTKKEYIVMGLTGNVYTVSIQNTPMCTCPDNKYRHNRCKHIFFILLRVMHSKEVDVARFSDSDLKDMFLNSPVVQNSLKVRDYQLSDYKNKQAVDIKGGVVQRHMEVDDECPVCLELLSDGGELVYCKALCGNSIHKQCFEMWDRSQNETSCIFCRTKWSDGEEYVKLNVF